MLRSLWLLGLYIAFMALGLSAPFVATLGYVWVDTFQPQYVAYIVLNQFPVSMVMGAAAFGMYLLLDRRSPPPLSAELVLMVLFVAWFTASNLWAVRPADALVKWDWAFKTVLFAVFIPYVIRSRVQIEAFATAYVFSLAANFVPFGLKTIISGGGYGVNLGLQGGNGGLAEGGFLSTFCLMSVPLTLFLGRHGQLIPRIKFMPLAYWAVAGLAVVTAVGTYERSALVGLVFLLAFLVVHSKHKVGYAIIAAVVLVGLVYATSHQWSSRISTIGDFEREGSAYTRILVWRWTLDFVSTHPAGGGFLAFIVNTIALPGMNGGEASMMYGRAWHSSYFEILGEQGYPGFAMFISIIGLTFFKLYRTGKRARAYPELEWVWALSRSLQAGIVAFLTAGAFVSVGYQPMIWYLISLGISLNAYMYRVEHGSATHLSGWRAMAAMPDTSGWRTRPAGAPPIGSAARRVR